MAKRPHKTTPELRLRRPRLPALADAALPGGGGGRSSVVPSHRLVMPREPGPKPPIPPYFVPLRSGRLDILEFNKLVTDMRLEKDDPTGSQQAIRAPTADQPVPIGGYSAYGYGGGYGGQSVPPLPHGATADQPLPGGSRSAGFARDEPLGSMGSMGSMRSELQTRPGLAPADQPLGLVGRRPGPAPQHRPAADEPLPIGGRAGFAPEYRTGHRNT